MMMIFRKVTFYLSILSACSGAVHAEGEEGSTPVASKKKDKNEEEKKASKKPRGGKPSTLLSTVVLAGGALTAFSFVGKSWFEGEPRMDFTKGITSEVRAALVPHAGYRYSGKVSAQVLETVDWSRYDTIMILSAAHRSRVNAKLPEDIEAIPVPYKKGQIEVEAIPEIPFQEDKEALEEEHAWQMVLLFVDQINAYKRSLNQAPIKIAPFLIAEETSVDIFANYLKEHPRVFWLANTDLLHCTENCPDDPDKFDEMTLDHIEHAIAHGTDVERVRAGKGTMCGFHAVRLCTQLAHLLGLQVATRIQSNSWHGKSRQEAAGGKYVGYGGIALAPRDQEDAYGSQIAKLDRAYFRAMPQQVLQKHQGVLGHRQSNEQIERMAKSHRKGTDLTVHGIFVTIRQKGALRGCIGTFDMNEQDLGYAIARQTLQSALSDTRFEPITADELPLLSYEITLLGPRFTVYKKGDILTPFDAFKQRYKEHHGVTITFEDGRRATYLASVLRDMPHDRKARFGTTVEELRSKSRAMTATIRKIEHYACWSL